MTKNYMMIIYEKKNMMFKDNKQSIKNVIAILKNKEIKLFIY